MQLDYQIINMNDKIEIKENNVLIAKRVPPGDKWKLVANATNGPIHKSLTDKLEA